MAVGRWLLGLVVVVGCWTEAVRGAASATQPADIHLEAEEAVLLGTVVGAVRAGFTGRGYVTGFKERGDKMTLTVPGAKPGVYALRIRYSSPSGEKHCDVMVNGLAVSVKLAGTGEEFATAEAGKVELVEGRNTISIERGWGYFDVDAIDLVPVAVDGALKKVAAAPADGEASAEARALMRFLAENYGERTLAGQHQPKDLAYVERVTGKSPAIFSSDLVNYSPTRIQYGANPRGLTEKLIDNARAGHVITLSWHWNAPDGLYNRSYTDAKGKTIDAPWWRGVYADATTFDLERALDVPESKEHEALVRDIDAIGVQLRKLADAGVPVLWRPLHEAEGGWFWWGAHGPERFKQLWRVMFERLTVHDHLHNLLWVYTSGGNMQWYPGDGFVDLVGTDAYPQYGDPLSGIYDELKGEFDGKKMLALSEIGAAPDLEKMRRFGVRWCYFLSWEGDVGPSTLPVETLRKLYGDAGVVMSLGLPAGVLPPKGAGKR